ncbi:hypothetical protein D041_0402, partial [Vibrio parahaemolyticus EKP-008]
MASKNQRCRGHNYDDSYGQ